MSLTHHKEGLDHAIATFNKAREHCAAYKDFLINQSVNASKPIMTVKDFNRIPLTTKSSYIEKYPIDERLYRGKNLSDYYMICTSSGSTGEPTIWPRDYEFDQRVIKLNTGIYERLFDINNKSTLVVVTFGLGAWTAGMLTSRLCWETSKGHGLSVITPGLDKVVALKVMQQLGKYYDQTVVTGYPPFIIELIEYGLDHGFDFKKINLKIHYTSARLSENRRNYLANIVSSTESRYDVLGFYACSETGIVGIETKDTIDILQYTGDNPELSLELFGDSQAPTFIEYNPHDKYLEAVDGNIVVTADQPAPLLRFDMKDRGGILTGDQILAIIDKFNIAVSQNISDKHFAYIFGRSDAVRILNNIYVDDILYCLENSKYEKRFTHNFKYGLEESGLKNRLKLLVYLKKGEKVDEDEKADFVDELYENLSKVNADFRMIQRGISIEKFHVEFLPDSEDRYQHGKFKHFL